MLMHAGVVSRCGLIKESTLAWVGGGKKKPKENVEHNAKGRPQTAVCNPEGLTYK